MQRQGTPFVAHVFVCVNERTDGSKSCGNGLGLNLKDLLKAGVEARGWKGRVRISHTGCMGLCARGPNVMVQPQGVWFSGVAPEDVPAILDEVGRRLASG